MNEAAADPQYTNRRLRFTSLYIPGYVSNGIEKQSDGSYCMWFSNVDTRTNKHVRCYFRRNQAQALSNLKEENLSIEGICKGKTGSTPTLVADVVQSWPVVDFTECELVK
jgi:hypothetical protein